MADPVPALVLDLLEWVDARPRSYGEVLEVWRTSCPRLPVWETANDLGLLEHHQRPGAETLVAVSPSGRARLRAARATTRR